MCIRDSPSTLDYDAYAAFDLEYEYDIREVFDKYLRGEIALSHYLDMLNYQEGAYPAGYNKLRFLENHDQPRIASFVRDEAALRNYTAMLYFLKGTTLLYAGQDVYKRQAARGHYPGRSLAGGQGGPALPP